MRARFNAGYLGFSAAPAGSKLNCVSPMPGPGLLIALSLISGNATASDFSFVGNFKHDDEVQEFKFAVAGAAKEVVLRTWSFAGGTNAGGAAIEHHRFDPMVTFSTPQAFAWALAMTAGCSVPPTLSRATLGMRSSRAASSTSEL